MPTGLLKKILDRIYPADAREHDSAMAALVKHPLDPELHYELAKLCAKNHQFCLANAELLSAQFLGLRGTDTDLLSNHIRTGLPDPLSFSHNEYFRYASLANEIKAQSKETPSSVLDVGGANGQLALFLPRYSYCLAEPQVNGISGTDLPFEDESFDYVVSCHVLEHIPLDQRDRFLSELLAKSRKALILLNPFNIPATQVRKRLRLVMDVTNSDWAREHLDCTLPELEMIEHFARDRDLELIVKPNGTMTTSLALVFMEHFASTPAQQGHLRKISNFYNSLPLEIHNSESQPNSYLVTLKTSDRGQSGYRGFSLE